MDIQYLMKQAKKLEKAMADARETLSGLTVDAESGGGLVKVQMNGKCEIVRLTIDPKALEPSGSAGRRAEAQPQHGLEPSGSAGDPADLAMLEDLVSAAVNAGVEKARAAADAHMAKATGGVTIPGLG
ncbi:MAG TPA: YbaB/EbfC family nucleoid-associated protein [Anaeromyxobacter sp.]